jgi:hypothetical protein
MTAKLEANNEIDVDEAVTATAPLYRLGAASQPRVHTVICQVHFAGLPVLRIDVDEAVTATAPLYRLGAASQPRLHTDVCQVHFAGLPTGLAIKKTHPKTPAQKNLKKPA